MRYKGIIFDLDGVICHTDEYHYLAWKRLADEIGVYFDRSINKYLRGVSRKESLELILEKSNIEYSEEEKTYLAKKKNEYYRSFLSAMSPAELPLDVKFTLDYLKRNHKLAIGSSSQNTDYILEKIGLNEYFDAVVSGLDIVYSKPHPEVFLKAAERLELSCKECLVVEDAESGIIAGASGCFDTAGLNEAAAFALSTYHLNGISDLISICS